MKSSIVAAVAAALAVGACQTNQPAGSGQPARSGSTELQTGTYFGYWEPSSPPVDSTLYITEVTASRIVVTYECNGCGGIPHYSEEFDVSRDGNSFYLDVGDGITFVTTANGGIWAEYRNWEITYTRTESP